MKKKSVTQQSSDPHSSNHNTWVCSSCYPFALEIGKIYGVGSLIFMIDHPMDTLAPEKYGKGTYAILGGQGHRDDEVAFLSEKPVTVYDKNIKYYDTRPYNIDMSMSASINLYETYIKNGLVNANIDSYKFQELFISRIAGLVNRFEKKYGVVETIYEKFLTERIDWVISKRNVSHV